MDSISAARAQARAENYEDAFVAFNLAQELIEDEVAACQVPEDMKKWKYIQDGIKAEIAAIDKYKQSYETCLQYLDAPPPAPIGKMDDDEEVDTPVWGREDPNEIPPIRAMRAPAKRPVVDTKPKKPANNYRPSQPHARNQPGPSNNNNGRYSRNSKGNAPAPPSKSPAQKPALDPETNPLVQQIIDMGILVREPNVSWDSIAGLQQVKRLLRKNLVILPLRPDIAKGLLAPWKSVLFYGPPGTGKTFLAKAVATECKRTFFNVTSATITSRYLGESEKLVSHLFTLAQQMAPSTIFFDEIDSIASQRGTAHEGEPARRMKAQLLTALEGIDGASDQSNVFVLAATNFPWDLDEALLRRFQKRIYIPLPDNEGRESILRMQLGEMADENFDFKGNAEKLEGYSCADITNLCRDAVQRIFDKQMDQLQSTEAFLNMPAEEARVIIKNSDFADALSHRRSSVDPDTLKKYEQWKMLKGAE